MLKTGFKKRLWIPAQDVPDLTAVGARYHPKCTDNLFLSPKDGIKKKGRPRDKADKAMEPIYEYIKNHSDECQFYITRLISKMKEGYNLSMQTVKSRLKEKYGEEIIFSN